MVQDHCREAQRNEERLLSAVVSSLAALPFRHGMGDNHFRKPAENQHPRHENTKPSHAPLFIELPVYEFPSILTQEFPAVENYEQLQEATEEEPTGWIGPWGWWFKLGE